MNKAHVITIMTLAALNYSCTTNRATLNHLGRLSGSVIDIETDKPLEFVNVVVWDSEMGAMTDADGRFTIPDVPPGQYSIKAMRMGHRTLEANVTVVAGETSWRNFRMLSIETRHVPDLEEPIGSHVDVQANDLSCEIIPAKDQFRLGDKPDFEVVLHNNSDKTFFLVHSVDGSTRLARYPHAELTLEGPDDGVVFRDREYDDSLNPLRQNDFGQVAPGGDFKPFAHYWLPAWVYAGRFDKPGTYVVTFRYSTDESDFYKWSGAQAAGYLPTYINDWMPKVPKLELSCSVSIEVVE